MLLDVFVARNDTCMSEDDLNANRTNIRFSPLWKEKARTRICKANLSPQVIYYLPFQGGTFIMVFFVKCSGVLLLKFVFWDLCKLKIYSVMFANQSSTILGNGCELCLILLSSVLFVAV